MNSTAVNDTKSDELQRIINIYRLRLMINLGFTVLLSIALGWSIYSATATDSVNSAFFVGIGVAAVIATLLAFNTNFQRYTSLLIKLHSAKSKT